MLLNGVYMKATKENQKKPIPIKSNSKDTGQMNPRQFFDLVADMRSSQKEYFRTRSSQSLQKSKELEKKVDAEIERVNNIINPSPQGELNFEQ